MEAITSMICRIPMRFNVKSTDSSHKSISQQKYKCQWHSIQLPIVHLHSTIWTCTSN